MSDTNEPSSQGEQEIEIPTELALLPLFNFIVYPMMISPLAVGQAASVKLIDDAMLDGRTVALVTLRNEEQRPEKPTLEDFSPIGTVALVHRLLRLPDGTLRVAIQGVERIRIEQITQTEPYLRARISVLPDAQGDPMELAALSRNVQTLATQVLQSLPAPSEELQIQIASETEPRRLAYLVASTMLFRSNVAERQEILELPTVRDKLARLNEILTRELEVLRIGQEIQTQVQSGIDKNQREYVLREQLRTIQQELGEGDENRAEIDRLRAAINDAGMSQEAREVATREVERLAQMPPAAAEYGIIRTYLETMIALPWNKHTDDMLDIRRAQQVLDEDHYDLEKIKARILEHLAVRELRSQRLGAQAGSPRGAILCFVGPPGVGKTSLGRSIARAMGREFLRIALGGVRDEAEIRGHRRTYIGALPGTVIQSLRRVGVNNPVFMLDEIDKLGNDFRGDPASALLEVLDPEQNVAFRDHYLDVAWDLSKTLFIATANTLQTIPVPLLDRMEIIQLSGYTVREKLEIARRYLLPEQLAEHALTEQDILVGDDALQVAIEEYTREAGVRNLEREIAALCRRTAVEIASGDDAPDVRLETRDEAWGLGLETGNASPKPQAPSPKPQAPSPTSQAPSPKPQAPSPITVDAAKARAYLGRRRFYNEEFEQIDRPGIVTGLVWTPVGGDIIFIECTAMPGSKGFLLTGQLGDVMKESAQAALSWVRAEGDNIGVDTRFFETHDIHMHVPAGATPKDGPSAGIAMATALTSLLTGRRVRDALAMTGEITLRGRVLPIGGVKEKVLAAHRAGITTIILPHRNQDDLDDVPAEVRDTLRFVFAERVTQVLEAALEPQASEPPVGASG